MKYLPHDGTIYNTNFTDDILSVEWRESELENDDPEELQVQGGVLCAPASGQAHHRQTALQCTADGGGMQELENILWSEVGTRQDYEAEVG